MSEPIADALAEALVAALAELTTVATERTAQIPTKSGGQFSYKYADIADVVALTRPALAKHGLVALTPVHAHDGGLACTVIIVHTSGERLTFPPLPFPPGHDAQGTGSTITYHRRYALVAALGMAAGDETDGAAAATAPSKAKPGAKKAPPSLISPENVTLLLVRCEEAGVDPADVVAAATDNRTDDPTQLLVSDFAAVRDALAALKQQPSTTEEQANGPEVGNGNGTQDRDSSGPGSRTRKATT